MPSSAAHSCKFLPGNRGETKSPFRSSFCLGALSSFSIEVHGLKKLLNLYNIININIYNNNINPLMPKRYHCTFIWYIVFKKQILYNNTDFFNPLFHKAQNIECQNQLFPLQIKPVKVS